MNFTHIYRQKKRYFYIANVCKIAHIALNVLYLTKLRYFLINAQTTINKTSHKNHLNRRTFMFNGLINESMCYY